MTREKEIVKYLIDNFEAQFHYKGLCSYFGILLNDRSNVLIARKLANTYIKDNTTFNRLFFDKRRIKTTELSEAYYWIEYEKEPRLNFLKYIYEKL